MKPKRYFIFTLLGVTALLVISIALLSVKVKAQVKELFRMNKDLQEQGYYMADFEFRMLGFAYTLDKGRYFKALYDLSEYNKNLKNRTDLIKLPAFKSKEGEIEFFRHLQNPVTGAFIDESVPYCTYWEVSQNIINHLEALTDTADGPLKLLYPLTFLDEINSPAKLTAFLNDVSYISRLAAKFPQTSFHFARNILSCAASGNVLERNKLYSFSPEWKHALLKWMYDFQDTATGMWGPKHRKSHKLLKYDLNNTASIIKVFRDNDGNDLYSDFPLRYPDRIFSTSLSLLSEPYPADEENLDEIHEWNLRNTKGMKMLMRYLWKEASERDKLVLKQRLEDLIKLQFDKYYVRSEGAFSFYPGSAHASPDGFTNMIYDDIGAFSYEKQKKLWGNSVDSVKNMGSISLENWESFLQEILKSGQKINSIRFYTSTPDLTDLTGNVWAVFYPGEAFIPDATDLLPGVMAWLDSTSMVLGNWTTIAQKKKELGGYNIRRPLIMKGSIKEPAFEPEKKYYAVGFNILQLPEIMLRFDF